MLTVTGQSLGEVLDWWETIGPPRRPFASCLQERDGVDPDDVIMPPAEARRRGLTSTVCFPRGNLAPGRLGHQSHGDRPGVVDADGVYRKTGPARVFTTERDAIAAIKGQAAHPLKPGDVLVLIGRGPMGTGMEETYQITSALKFLKWGREVAVVTDARFSGVSTGACIGHVGPEALAGGPIGKVRDGDLIRIVVDRNQLIGTVDLVGEGAAHLLGRGGRRNSRRPLAAAWPRARQGPAPDTKLWAALQRVGGGTWGGCVYDVEKIVAALELGGRSSR